ncbi:MAG: hypothetical protein CGU28_15560 [Candidatus Dactylopiibacterium carminicum]|nr:AraC family transcriptional regulator [Candidatus Dactylopiibacterium carminicum]PAS93164.1 MAG: hypothetical protein CGU28_15560 [Candidatus Dactylopiibacterium carminicum]PAS96199.1 MAG: hypothetical protein BSR46_15795 [Candidatus Dactylopiibacterium carminicum]
MRMTAELFCLQSWRIGRVVDYLGTHLDEDVTLARLAEVACLSASQLERLYRGKVGETPLGTLRRLRLDRALQQLRGCDVSVRDVALAAGYGSAAAFNHAFLRRFGAPPGRAALAEPVRQLPDLHLAHLPDRPVFELSYTGPLRERGHEVGVLVGNLAVAGAKRWRLWETLDRDHPWPVSGLQHIAVRHFVPAAGLPQQVAKVGHVRHAGGLHAVWHVLGRPAPGALLAVCERIRTQLGCVLREDAPLLQREVNVHGYTPPQERRVAVYLPVTPAKRRS